MTELLTPSLIAQALEMKESGVYVSDISKKLTEQTGKKITQISLWRIFNQTNANGAHKTAKEFKEPSRDEIELIFSKSLQKERNAGPTHRGTTIDRRVMLQILNNYHNKEFTYDQLRIDFNKWKNAEIIQNHFHYLTTYNFIIPTTNNKYVFSDRVKKWRSFGQI